MRTSGRTLLAGLSLLGVLVIGDSVEAAGPGVPVTTLVYRGTNVTATPVLFHHHHRGDCGPYGCGPVYAGCAAPYGYGYGCAAPYGYGAGCAAPYGYGSGCAAPYGYGAYYGDCCGLGGYGAYGYRGGYSVYSYGGCYGCYGHRGHKHHRHGWRGDCCY